MEEKGEIKNNKPDIEDIILEKILSSKEINLETIPDNELKVFVRNKITEINYLNEEWQVSFAVERIIGKINIKIKRINKINDWRRHFLRKNFFINLFIAFIPAAIIIGILKEITKSNLIVGVPIFLILGIFMLIVGIIREKIKNKNYNNQLNIKKEGLAIASLICGTIGIYVFIMSIGAIICGHLALNRIKKDPNLYSGRALAIYGLVLGYFWLIIRLIL
jgi:hypothetical protein